MSWERIPIPGGSASSPLPGARGSYLLLFEPPFVEGSSRFVHFSWRGDSYCVRDYVKGMQTRNLDDLTAEDLWNAAKDRISCTGKLYVRVENVEFWRNKLTDLSEARRAPLDLEVKRPVGTSKQTGERTSGQSSWGGQQSSTEEQPESESPYTIHREHVRNGSGLYRDFIGIWADGIGFEIIERTVGCSARFRGEPLLWVYPRYFQVAPEGKGNAHHDEVRHLMDRHFPEVHKGRLSFSSAHFTWDRFQDFVGNVKNTIPAIRERLGDLEDLQIAEQRMIDIRAGKFQTVPLEKVMKSYGLDDRS